MPRVNDEICIQCQSGTLKKEVRFDYNILYFYYEFKKI